MPIRIQNFVKNIRIGFYMDSFKEKCMNMSMSRGGLAPQILVGFCFKGPPFLLQKRIADLKKKKKRAI
jgi:hypothetical protein